MTEPSRARRLSEASMAAVRDKDKDAWVALFAEDGWVEDPVGPSGFDPEGRGHHGAEAIGAFWDAAIAQTESIEFLVDDRIDCGDEAVNIGTIRSAIGGGLIDAEGVFVYRAAPGGDRLQSLRAFWEVDRAMKTFRTTD